MGKINTKRALLITGTVIPHSNYVAHTSVEKRLQEYAEGLAFYAAMFPDDDLYFLENSEYDFSKDRVFTGLFAKHRITLMKFPVSDKFDQGKGYQEFEMLDQAVEQLSPRYQAFIKITGRYKVHNLAELTDVECKGLVADLHKKPLVLLTNVFYATADFYKSYLKDLYLQVDDSKGLFIEKAAYNKVMAGKGIEQVELFKSSPVITGTSGSYGGTLNRNKLKMRIRNVERGLLRLFGIKQFLIEY